MNEILFSLKVLTRRYLTRLLKMRDLCVLLL